MKSPYNFCFGNFGGEIKIQEGRASAFGRRILRGRRGKQRQGVNERKRGRSDIFDILVPVFILVPPETVYFRLK